MPQKLLLFFLLFGSLSLFAQQMQEGFTFLETGQYAKAETFFETILEEYPQNKTARLCYGRALGLSGKSDIAITIFTNLKNEFPNDFEVKLNYAEALLWNKQYEEASLFYDKLVLENSSSFPAILGYANTLSNLKNYEKALEYVNKALEIQNGNKNALISRKYVKLGYANKFSQRKEYDKALQLLDENLVDFPNDMDTQLNRANIYLMISDLENAEKTYTMIAANPQDSITALNGLSLVAHKSYKNIKALELAILAKNKVAVFKENKNLYLSTYERYIQALLWNKKFVIAKQTIKDLKQLYPENPRVWSLQATRGMYTGDFDMSLERYNKILDSDESSFDGNLGIANAYRALSDDMMAYTYAFNTLEHFPNQTDAEKLIETLKKKHTPWIQQKTALTFDNGNNEATTASLTAEIPFSTKFKTLLDYTYRTTRNTVTNNKAITNELSLNFSYQLARKIIVATRGGISKSNAFTNDYTQWTGQLQLKTKPYKLQNLDIGYQRVLQNFNADLIDREIVMNNYFLNYNLGTNINLGWYTQYMYTTQTDENTRNLLFTSLYYSFLDRPAIKAGINYQHITFKNQVPTVYFSPEKFNVVEVFSDMTSTQTKKWFYGASVAGGYQFIEDDPGSTTFRAEGKLGRQITNRFIGTVYGKYSNIASATAAGFRFSEFGLLLKWYFFKKPIFNKKIVALKK